MRLRNFFIIVALSLFFAVPGYAGGFSLPKIHLPSIPGLPTGNISPSIPNIPNPTDLLANAALGQEAITTSIKDSSHEIPYLDDFSPLEIDPLIGLGKDKDGNFLVTPGCFSSTLQSYCLHAGTHGPTQGAGYVLTTLKGPKAYIINKILTNSPNHPDIPQYKIQSLIWAIEAHANYQTMSSDMRDTAVKLLSDKTGIPSPRDALELAGGAVAFLPQNQLNQLLQSVDEAARPIYQAQNEIRQASTLPDSFRQMEQVAVLGGTPPPDKNDRAIPGGRWSYTDSGVFVRYFPSGYSRTRTEVYCPEPFFIRYDKTGLIQQIESGDHGYRLGLAYQSESESPEQSNQHILSSVTLFGGGKVMFHATLTGRIITGPPSATDPDAVQYQQLIDMQRRFIGNKPRLLTSLIINLTNLRDGFSKAITELPNADDRDFLNSFVERAWVATAYEWINEDKGSVHIAFVSPNDTDQDKLPALRLAQYQLVIPLIEVLVGDIELTAGERTAINALRLALQNMVACPGDVYAQRLAISCRGSGDDTILYKDPDIIIRVRENGTIQPAIKDEDGKCDPNQPPTPNYKWQDKGNEHGGTLGFHWHWQEWNLNRATCIWYLSNRQSGPIDPSIIYPGKIFVELPGLYL